MAFRSTYSYVQNDNKLPQNPPNNPVLDIWAIFRALRDARNHFGLRSGQLQTLQAMLSFLKPGQGDVVFASNSEICRRIGGIDERTLRRHIERFVELGFMFRHNSPNKKRYRVRSSQGASLSFGISLEPFFKRSGEILEVAEQVEQDNRDRIFTRKRILTQLSYIEEAIGADNYTAEIRKILRRKLNLTEYQAVLVELQAKMDKLSTAVDTPKTSVLPAKDGLDDRHHSTSKQIDKENRQTVHDDPPEISILSQVCSEACSFAEKPMQDWNDVSAHAEKLAPMMGISDYQYQNAVEKIGLRKAASAIFIILQMGRQVRNFASYFVSLTQGKKAQHFQPNRILERMAAA